MRAYIRMFMLLFVFLRSLFNCCVVVDFFNRINLMYGTICDFCTSTTCPVMSGGPKYEYYWSDGDKYKKPTAVPAPNVSVRVCGSVSA